MLLNSLGWFGRYAHIRTWEEQRLSHWCESRSYPYKFSYVLSDGNTQGHEKHRKGCCIRRKEFDKVKTNSGKIHRYCLIHLQKTTLSKIS